MNANPCRCCGKDLGWISPERLSKHVGLFIHATCDPVHSIHTSNPNNPTLRAGCREDITNE